MTINESYSELPLIASADNKAMLSIYLEFTRTNISKILVKYE